MDINYSNSFTAFGRGLQDALAKQEAKRRLEEQDALVREREQRLKAHDEAATAEAKARTAQLAAQRESEAAARKVAMAETVRKPLAAGTVLDNTGDTANILREGGMGGLLQDDPNSGQTLASHSVAAPMIGLGATPEAQAAAPVMAAQDDPAKALKTTYLGDAKQQEEAAQQKAVLDAIAAVEDPTQKQVLELAVRSGAKLSLGDLQKVLGGPEMTDVYDHDPRTGKLVKTGSVPKGSHIATIPQPPSSSTIIFNSPEQKEAALRTAARQYLQDGTMPPMGMGGAAGNFRVEVLAEVDRLVRESGGRLNPQEAKVLMAADKRTLSDLQVRTAAVNAYKNTAKANIQTLLTQMEKVPQTGIPLANKLGRALSLALGGEEVAGYEAALGAVQPEVARILFNPQLTGVLSDSARREAQDLLKDEATPGQLRAALRVLENDMNQRESKMQAEMEIVRKRIQDRDPYAAQGGATPGVVAPANETPEQRRKRLYDELSQ